MSESGHGAPTSAWADAHRPRLAGLGWLAGWWALALVFGATGLWTLSTANENGFTRKGYGAVDVIAFAALTVLSGLMAVNRTMARGSWQEANARAYTDALQLASAAVGRLQEDISTDGTTSGMTVASGWKLGELSRQFDQQTTATVEGWLDHRLGSHGWGVAASAGRLGLGTGRFGLSGSSSVHLNIDGTTRANPLGDGFIAILEDPADATRVLRLVVLSEPAVHAFLSDMLVGYAAHLPGTHYASAMASAAELQQQIDLHLAVSHVSDRLAGVLRMHPPSRPSVDVVGAPLGPHAILGGAIRFGKENEWLEVFPFERIALVDASARALRPRSAPSTRS